MGSIIIIDDSLFRDFETIKTLVGVLLRLKKPYNVDVFLIPDETYDALVDILKPVKPEIDEYSTRKWLTGFIPDVDKSFYYKLYSILARKDVKKISQYYENLKPNLFASPLEQVLAAINLGALVMVSTSEVEKYLVRNSSLKEIKIKKTKDIIILES
ncbi:MAG: hypothetical protein ACP6IP_00920 [Candidatus Njordarchaeia archaeon]